MMQIDQDVEARIRHANRMAQHMGLRPLTIDEIHQALRAHVPLPPINGADTLASSLAPLAQGNASLAQGTQLTTPPNPAGALGV